MNNTFEKIAADATKINFADAMGQCHPINHTLTQRSLYAVAVFVGAFIFGSMLLPMPVERKYDLVQIDADGESEIVDYDLTATDCGLSRDRLMNRGLHVLCEGTN